MDVRRPRALPVYMRFERDILIGTVHARPLLIITEEATPLVSLRREARTARVSQVCPTPKPAFCRP